MATETPVSGAPVGRQVRPRLYYGYYIVGASLIAQLISTGAQNSVAGAFLRPMTHDLGWTRAQFTYGLTVSRFVAAGAGVFVGVWVDRYGGRRLMMAGSALFFVSTWLTGSVTELWQWVVLRGFVLTIGASLVERAGLPVAVVPGSAANLKITQPGDLALAEFYLSQRAG